jgi:hypothetical protein
LLACRPLYAEQWLMLSSLGKHVSDDETAAWHIGVPLHQRLNMVKRETKVAGSERVQRASPVMLGKWLAVLAAVATPFCYLNGRAFHDGYLARLRLEPSMFPTDVQGTFIAAARAWMEGAATVLGAISKALAAHWFLTLLLPTLLLIGLSAATHHLIHWMEIRRRNTLPQELRVGHGPSIGSILAPVFALLFGAYALYTLFALIRAVLLLSIGPFVQIGARVAANDLERGFPNAPAVELSAPNGSVAVYRIIECADKFCAVYRTGDVVTVPITAIAWATSQLSGSATRR